MYVCICLPRPVIVSIRHRLGQQTQNQVAITIAANKQKLTTTITYF